MTVALLALLPLATGATFADNGEGYSRMFVFGASFLDPGNHFAVTGETAHPPFDPMSLASYGIGGHHYSNGPTWVEVLAQELNLTKWAQPAYRNPAFGNYAFGYARAREVDYPAGPSLSEQVQDWIDNGYCTFEPMDDTLFVLDTSYYDLGDILFGQNPAVVLPGMLASIDWNIGVLHECGARKLLVVNSPPLGLSPMIPAESKGLANAISVGYNEAVQGVLAMLYADESFEMIISTFDLFSLFSGFAATPENYGLTNVEATCVNYGVLRNAFCKDRDGYLFWDPLHPTKQVHALIGEHAIEQLPALD